MLRATEHPEFALLKEGLIHFGLTIFAGPDISTGFGVKGHKWKEKRSFGGGFIILELARSFASGFLRSAGSLFNYGKAFSCLMARSLLRDYSFIRGSLQSNGFSLLIWLALSIWHSLFAYGSLFIFGVHSAITGSLMDYGVPPYCWLAHSQRVHFFAMARSLLDGIGSLAMARSLIMGGFSSSMARSQLAGVISPFMARSLLMDSDALLYVGSLRVMGFSQSGGSLIQHGGFLFPTGSLIYLGFSLMGWLALEGWDCSWHVARSRNLWVSSLEMARSGILGSLVIRGSLIKLGGFLFEYGSLVNDGVISHGLWLARDRWGLFDELARSDNLVFLSFNGSLPLLGVAPLLWLAHLPWVYSFPTGSLW